MKSPDIYQIAQWLFATAAVSVSSSFALIHFAYSDFDTQRTNDIYREQVSKRLDDISSQIVEVNRKVDEILLRK